MLIFSLSLSPSPTSKSTIHSSPEFCQFSSTPSPIPYVYIGEEQLAPSVQALNLVRFEEKSGSCSRGIQIAMAATESARRRGQRKAKEAAVGAAARALFYPTLLYNVVRSKVQAEFRWWDEVDQFILLGAVPFRKDVPRLQKLGVHGVITLNEPFETLVPSSMYQSRGIDHLVIPTRDYMFAPSLVDINQAIDFIHRNTSCGRMTYIHCKAGRGRSTTIVLCYLVKYKNMTPTAAFEYVRSKRARVLLTRSQWKVVQEFSTKVVGAAASKTGDVVLSTEDGSGSPGVIKNNASLSSNKTTPSRPMMKMLSCLLPSPVRSGNSLSHADLHT